MKRRVASWEVAWEWGHYQSSVTEMVGFRSYVVTGSIHFLEKHAKPGEIRRALAQMKLKEPE